MGGSRRVKRRIKKMPIIEIENLTKDMKLFARKRKRINGLSRQLKFCF